MADTGGSQIPQVYTLTKLTRSAGQSRRVVVAGFDAPLRGLVVTILALAVSAIPTMILWLAVGPLALVLSMLTVGAAFYLVEGRTRSGLRLRTYQAMINKKRERIGQFMCCGQSVFPRMSGFGLFLQSSMPSPHLVPASAQVDSLLAPELPEPAAPELVAQTLTPNGPGSAREFSWARSITKTAPMRGPRSLVESLRQGRRGADLFSSIDVALPDQPPAVLPKTDDGMARSITRPRATRGSSGLRSRRGGAAAAHHDEDTCTCTAAKHKTGGHPKSAARRSKHEDTGDPFASLSFEDGFSPSGGETERGSST